MGKKKDRTDRRSVGVDTESSKFSKKNESNYLSDALTMVYLLLVPWLIWQEFILNYFSSSENFQYHWELALTPSFLPFALRKSHGELAPIG